MLSFPELLNLDWLLASLIAFFSVRLIPVKLRHIEPWIQVHKLKTFPKHSFVDWAVGKAVCFAHLRRAE